MLPDEETFSAAMAALGIEPGAALTVVTFNAGVALFLFLFGFCIF